MMIRNLLIVAIFAIAGCKAADAPNSNIPDEVEVLATAIDAEGVTKALQSAGLPMVDIIVVTEENDDNQMLGRPGHYSSKTYFVDSRHDGEGMEPEEQNTVEVFDNAELAVQRKEYIEKIISGIPMFTQYIIQKGPVVLRLDKSVTPTQAREYEAALDKI